MILTVEEFIDSGLKVSVDNKNAQQAIEDAELFYVKSVLGDSNYIHFNEPVIEGTPDYYIVNGGIVNDIFVPGLKRAISHIAFAFLIRMNINAVRFGTVKKDDQNSSNADETTIYNTAKHHFTIGKAYLKNTCQVISGANFKNAPGLAFNEFNELI